MPRITRIHGNQLTTDEDEELRRMDDRAQFRAIYGEIERANLHDLLPCRWSVEDHEGCDLTHMLRTVCIDQTGETLVPIAEAISLLSDGFCPRGATPYPEAAAALLERRRRC